MSTDAAGWLILVTSLLGANLPWLTERRFFFFASPKSMAIRLVEWLLMLALCGLLAFGLERKMTGAIFPKQWEFWVVGISLFAVFSLPGIIWRSELRRRLSRRRERRAQSR